MTQIMELNPLQQFAFTELIAAKIPNGVVLAFDHDLRYIFAEGESLAKHGYNKAAMLGKTMMDVLPEATVEQLKPLYEKTLTGEETRMEFADVNGEHFVIQFLPARGPQGNIFAGILVVNDQTEIKRANKALSDKNLELETVNNMLAHDIKSPMTTLLLMIEMMQLEKDPQALAAIQLRTQRLVEKTRSFIDSMLSNITDHINFHEIIEDLTEDLKKLPQFDKITFEKNIDLTEQDYWGVKKYVISLLRNLLSNAFKYYDPSKEIMRVSLAIKQVEAGVKIMVIDNGTGITHDQQAEIFEWGARDNRDVEGTGVGLYIVKSIVDRYGGTITLNSELGNGSRFEVVLPLLKNAAFADQLQKG